MTPLEALDKINTMFLAYSPRDIREDKELNEDLFECIKTAIKNQVNLELENKTLQMNLDLGVVLAKGLQRKIDESQRTIDKLSNEIKHLKATNRRNENKAKALKIIREKRVFIEELIESDDLEEYNYWVEEQGRYDEDKLIKKEYDLLKEILNEKD